MDRLLGAWGEGLERPRLVHRLDRDTSGVLLIAKEEDVRKRLGAAVAPKEIDFVDSLPHTRSGKIMRRLLKARELGLPEGDTSTVETTGVRA